jgi:hypothetical protein
MTPKRLISAGVIAFVLFLGAVQSEMGSGESNVFTPILGLVWPVLIVAGIVTSIVRRVRRGAQGDTRAESEKLPVEREPDERRGKSLTDEEAAEIEDKKRARFGGRNP